jgi:hypothetical protein
MARSILPNEYVKAMDSQKRKFGNAKEPGHPDPKMFRLGNREQVVDWMALWQIEPYWGKDEKTGKGVVRFRSIPRKGGEGPWHVRNAVDDIKLYRTGLGLDVKDEEKLQDRVAEVREKIRGRAGF